MEFFAELGTMVIGPQAQFIGFLFTVLIILVGADVLTGWLRGWHQGHLGLDELRERPRGGEQARLRALPHRQPAAPQPRAARPGGAHHLR